MIADGPDYNTRTLDWVHYIDGHPMTDDDENVRHFLTAEAARAAAEAEVYGPRRTARIRRRLQEAALPYT
jgi:hypothetical protein